MVARRVDKRLHVWPEGSTAPGPLRRFNWELKVAMTVYQATFVEDLAKELQCSEPEVVRQAIDHLILQRRR